MSLLSAQTLLYRSTKKGYRHTLSANSRAAFGLRPPRDACSHSHRPGCGQCPPLRNKIPRHVEVLVKAFNLKDGGTAAAPGFKQQLLDDVPGAADDAVTIKARITAVHAHKKAFRVRFGETEICPDDIPSWPSVPKDRLLTGPSWLVSICTCSSRMRPVHWPCLCWPR